MIKNRLRSKHIDPWTLNFFVHDELHVGEEGKIRHHVKYCRLYTLYVVLGKAFKAAIAPVRFRFAPRAIRTAKANPARRCNLVYIDRPPAVRTAVNQVQPTLRELLHLCDVEKLSHRDIALILDILISTVPSCSSDT